MIKTYLSQPTGKKVLFPRSGIWQLLCIIMAKDTGLSSFGSLNKRGEKMFKLSILAVGVVTLMVGCAHSTMRGTVAMKATEEELHVCMGDKEVKAGDRVAFFVNQCRSHGARDVQKDICTKIKVGEGEVTQALNEHYSVVKPNPGVKVQEGTVVEKM